MKMENDVVQYIAAMLYPLYPFKRYAQLMLYEEGLDLRFMGVCNPLRSFFWGGAPKC